MDWIGIQCNLVIQSHSLSITLPLNHTPYQLLTGDPIYRDWSWKITLSITHPRTYQLTSPPLNHTPSLTHSLSITLPLHHTVSHESDDNRRPHLPRLVLGDISVHRQALSNTHCLWRPTTRYHTTPLLYVIDTSKNEVQSINTTY